MRISDWSSDVCSSDLCRYCMAEKMTFLPRDQILTLEEIAIIADRFIARGVRKIRLSGGEPLVRRDFGELVRRIGRHLKSGTLQELTLTTNGTQLAHHAEMLAELGRASCRERVCQYV